MRKNLCKKISPSIWGHIKPNNSNLVLEGGLAHNKCKFKSSSPISLVRLIFFTTTCIFATSSEMLGVGVT